MQPITAIIVIKGSPPHALESMDSVADFVSEIIIGDIGIDPQLKEAIKKYEHVTIVEINEYVPYVELIRDKLKKQAKNDYVLFLDPDEILPKDLKDLCAKDLSSFQYYSIPRKNIILGKWIEHSRWWPDYQIRLFDKRAVVWPKLIHEQPQTQGNEFKVEPMEKYAIIHHNYETIDEYMSKAVRYAKARATEMYTGKTPFTLGDAMKRAISEFISRFFALEGYKDGAHGFVLATLQMFYSFLVYFYLWEMKKYPNESAINLSRTAQTYFKHGLLETQHWMDKKNLQKKSVKDHIISKML
ncbi:hypothetical protein COY90_05395 [Candidatus Roizmanbacteria bacterium CG_4_10_14_0_8_um_filter_39_9]|uniref:Glycosyltransferase 2-like domain-containing protein n=1 Tax=Candidatus Roizmanbacteria bacterium CG_4_10_14_0_8_um_filter_39_9 TaxID=1974829 RepID=A0A2M7QBC5_9BACT|nr:MAG: hypothetical protein COY90_05395 [Candidatus Roizmanbacteria bacterium CG_4_10_14_0_8_um_filter_39_9]